MTVKTDVFTIAPDDAVWTCHTDFEGLLAFLTNPRSWVDTHGGLTLAETYTILKSPAKAGMADTVVLEANVHVEGTTKNVAFIRVYVHEQRAHSESSGYRFNGANAAVFASLWDIVRTDHGVIDMTVKYSRSTSPQKVSVHLELGGGPHKTVGFVAALMVEPAGFGAWLQGNTVTNWFETLPRGIDVPLARATGTREVFTSSVGPLNVVINGWNPNFPCPYPKVLVACNGTVGTYSGDPEQTDTTVDADESTVKWYCV